MTTLQSGILAIGVSSHQHIEFELEVDGDPRSVLQTLASLYLENSTIASVNMVIGVRPTLWDRCGYLPPSMSEDMPSDLISADGFNMPDTQGDFWVWISGGAKDITFDAARLVMSSIGGHAFAISCTSGWTYHHSKDLTGFMIGTENPAIADATEVVTRAKDGMSLALVQRWVHDLESFEGLSELDQEQVIGRTKEESIEIDEDLRPNDSHVTRTSIKEDGKELEIFRRSVAFGDPGRHGLVFVAFTPDQARIDRMLRRMCGLEDGIRDALTRYSAPISGSYYLVPPTEVLRTFI